MKNYVVSKQDNSIMFSFYPGEAYLLKAYVMKQFEIKFGFTPMFQVSEKNGIRIYLDTVSGKKINKKEKTKLQELQISLSNSIEAICSTFSFKIEQWNEDEMATCSICGRTYHESFVNLVDYQEDICIHCEQNYFKYDPTSKDETSKFISVYAFGGIVQFLQEGKCLQHLAKKMRQYLTKSGFDRHEDDARIFKMIGTKSEEVYSYTEKEDLLKDNEVEVYINEEDRIVLLNDSDIKDNMVIIFDPKVEAEALIK